MSDPDNPKGMSPRQIRRQLLATPGARLVATRVGRGCAGAPRRRTRFDLIRYKAAGMPQAVWLIALWWRGGWDSAVFLSRGEARCQYETGGRWPSWARLPPSIAG